MPTATNPNVITYAKYIKTLNTITAQYTDGVHVKATRHMGYNSDLATEEITDTSKLTQITTPWTGKTGKTVATEENLGGGDLGYNIDYNLVKNIYGTAIAYNISNTLASYWLASRDYDFDGSSGYFKLRYVNTSGGPYNIEGYMYFHNATSCFYYSFGFAIRPILTLKPDVTIANGSGSESNPYILN